jgi:hypothetical protein
LEILVLILFGLEGMLLFTGISFAALLYFSANRLRFSYVEIFANTAEDLAKSKIFKFIALLCSVSLFLVLSAQSFIVVSLIVSLSVILSIRILGVDTWLKGYLRND